MGTFSLAWLMANKIIHQSWYFGSVYFYLHFQYNGWFLFAILGLLFVSLKKWFTPVQIHTADRLFVLLLITILPAWFLSMMWMRLPVWMYYAADAAALLQLIAAYLFIRLALQLKKTIDLHPTVKWLWLIALSAFILKIILQAFSAIPELNKYAFGIRPVVIGFLHLVLLVFVSIFILGCFIQNNLITLEKTTSKVGLWIFIIAVLFNEFILTIQGISAILFTNFPSSNYLLLGSAITIFIGLFLVTLSQKKANGLF